LNGQHVEVEIISVLDYRKGFGHTELVRHDRAKIGPKCRQEKR
jgi:hypothetical protein